MSNTPNHDIPYVPEGTLDPAAGLNIALDDIDALVQTAVLTIGDNAPPGSNANGDLHIIGTAPTGAWAGHANALTRFVDEGGLWQFYTAGTQVNNVYNLADGNIWKFDNESSPTGWVLAGGFNDAPEDGTKYARKDGAWVHFSEAAPGATLIVTGLDSPSETVDPAEVLEFGAGFVITEDGSGVARVEYTAPDAGPGGGSITVQDGDSPPFQVDPAEVIEFGAGFTVTEGGSGKAVVEYTPAAGNSNLTPDSHPASPDAFDNEFESSITDFAWTNQGGATAAISDGSLVLRGTNNTSTNVRVFKKAIAGSTWRIRAKITDFYTANVSDAAYAGLILRNATSGKLITFHKVLKSAAYNLGVTHWTDVNTHSTDVQGPDPIVSSPLGASDRGPIHLEIELSGSLTFRYSASGVEGTFIDYATDSLAFISSVDEVGVFTNNETTNNQVVMVMDWLRKLA